MKPYDLTGKTLNSDVYIDCLQQLIQNREKPFRWTKGERQSLYQKVKTQYPVKLTAQRIKSGRELTMNCLGCHGEGSYLPSAYQFLASEARLQEEINAYPYFIWRVMAYLESHRMPKGFSLSDEEILALQAYFLQQVVLNCE